LTILAIIIVLPIRLYIAQPFIVNGASMDPAFETSQYLIIDQISYRFEEPKRGEVIVFYFPEDTSKFFIKRIIGLPEETVTIERGNVSVTTASGENISLDEPYIAPQNASDSTLAVKLGKNEYFVMGDNRESSSDSRIWGPLPRDLIVGRALVRLFPPTKMSIFPGLHDYNGEAGS